ncbi:uncharacterized protein LOC125449392 isoform X2 [Stegostoma tigrinum]|uniref:uncharacterized protein LOC125449392 isoform X2 n=1 Tax=Stegostoma tigrinum TaxID=3053191 RepID=UPI00286FC3AE|nr:uncharacterized protein LOC125449392 isoform X2 [Stegostoma tigrinum]
MSMEASGRQDRGSLRSEQHVRDVQTDSFGKLDRSSLKSDQSVKGMLMSGRHDPARSEHSTKDISGKMLDNVGAMDYSLIHSEHSGKASEETLDQVLSAQSLMRGLPDRSAAEGTVFGYSYEELQDAGRGQADNSELQQSHNERQ